MTEMNADTIIIFSILGVAILFFITEWLRADLVAVLVTVALAVSGVLKPEEAFSGFASNAVIAIASLLVIGAGLVRSGVVKWLADRIQSLVKGNRFLLKTFSTGIPGVLSGFINIVAAVAIFIPAVLRLARQNDMQPSKLLLPMAATGLAGANLTLIGASHNLVVNDLLKESGADAFGFFGFTLLGAAIVVSVMVYHLLLGKWLLPEHGSNPDQGSNPDHGSNGSDGSDGSDGNSDGEEENLLETYQMEERLWEVVVRRESSAVGKSVNEIGIGEKYGLSVIMVIRNREQISVEDADFTLEAEDVLALGGRLERLHALTRDYDGLRVMGQPDPSEEFSWSLFDMVDLVVPPRSEAIGKTLREMDFRKKTGLTGIAIWRNGRPFRTDARDRTLEPGDGLLLFGDREDVREFKPEPDFLWINRPVRESSPPELRHLGPFALAIFMAVIVVAAMDWLSIAVAALFGAAAMVLIRVLTPAKAYESIDWRTIVLVAGMYPIGTALEKSGAASQIATLLTDSIGAYGPLALMAAIALLSILLTQAMHNAVVAVIMTPVAIQSANAMNFDPKGLAIAVIVGASATFLLPVGHPAVMLVQEPGGYTTRDYLKFGIGLVILVFGVLMGIAPLLWPLQ